MKTGKSESPCGGSGAKAAQMTMVCLLLCGCASRPALIVAIGPDESPLAAGDCIVMEVVIGLHGNERIHVIDPTGEISMPLLGRLPVAGLTVKQVEELLEKEYVENRRLFSRMDMAVRRCP